MEAEAASEKTLITPTEHLTSRLRRERVDNLTTTIERDQLKVRVQQLEKIIEKLSADIERFPNSNR